MISPYLPHCNVHSRTLALTLLICVFHHCVVSVYGLCGKRSVFLKQKKAKEAKMWEERKLSHDKLLGI